MAAGPPPPPPPPQPPQAAPSTPSTAGQPVTSLQPNTAALLCYIPGLGWIAAAIFLTLYPYNQNRYVRFHAFQGLYLAVLWLLAQVFFLPLPGFHDGVFHPFFGIRGALKVAVLVAQIIGIVKTARNQDFRVPIVADLADRSLA